MLTYGFFNAVQQTDGTYDRVYDSNQIGNMFEGLISDGVYESVGDAMIVRAKSNMTIEVGTGRIQIGSKWLKNTALFNIVLDDSNVALNRWSAIVVRVNHTDRTIEIVEKKGAEATDAVKPEMEISQNIEEKCLAYVHVEKGATKITQANIVDTRADTNVCGWVTGIIKQVDTSELFLQWQDAYESFYSQMTSNFNAWFSALTGQLQVNTYIERYHKVIEMTEGNDVFKLDMDGYEYDEKDILLVNVNGIMLTEVHDYLLDTSKTPVEIHTNAEMEAENLLEITILKSKIGQP